MLQGLDERTYTFLTPNGSVLPKRQDSMIAVKAFVDALSEIASLDFVCEEESNISGLTATVIHPANTAPVAVLSVNYGARGFYYAKIVLKNGDIKRDLVIEDSDQAVKKLVKHLTNPASLKPKRKTGSRPIVIDIDIEDAVESSRYGRPEDFYN